MTRTIQVSLMHDRRLWARRFVEKVEAQGGKVFLRDDGGVRVWLEPAVTVEMKHEVAELGADLADYLIAREPVDVGHDPDAIVLSSTPSRGAEEIQADTKKAYAAATARRDAFHGGGEINIFNTNADGLTPLGRPNNFGHTMRLLAAQRERRPAGAPCWSPRPGTTSYMWHLFGDENPYDPNTRR